MVLSNPRKNFREHSSPTPLCLPYPFLVCLIRVTAERVCCVKWDNIVGASLLVGWHDKEPRKRSSGEPVFTKPLGISQKRPGNIGGVKRKIKCEDFQGKTAEKNQLPESLGLNARKIIKQIRKIFASKN